MRLVILFAVAVSGCGEPARPTPPVVATPPATPATTVGATPGSAASEAPGGWPVPTGWRSEVIPFPLDFAPTLSHRGIEELRFPPGFFDPAAADYWSYTFVWWTEDPAELDAAALGAELTVYFRGLVAAVDKDGRVTDREAIVARAQPAGPGRFTLTAHVFDAFKTAAPLDLTGFAERRPCGAGALWSFVLAPATTSIRGQLDELAAAAACK